MKKLLLILLFVPFALFGQQQCDISFETYNSGTNHTIFIDGSISTPLSSGDPIGVFYIGDDGLAICAGASLWTGQNLQIVAFGDDSTTPEIDGLVMGDPFLFVAQSGEDVYVVNASFQTPSMANYEVNGLSFVTSLDFIIGCPNGITGSTTATVEFAVDMNLVDQPSADYDNVVVNGSWNGWQGWGVTLADEDGDGVYTGSLEVDPGTSFEYVVAVTGSADLWSGWGMQWGDGCANPNISSSYSNYNNVAVTAGEAGSVTSTSLSAGCADVLGCMDLNASNYNADATVQGFDQWGNLQCVYASCDDIPEYGCIYSEGFGPFNEEFGSDLCSQYGGTPCGGNVDVLGCTDETASNFNLDANVDDGSCFTVVQGCTDENAYNYNHAAALSYDSGATEFHDISTVEFWMDINHYQFSVMVNQGGWNGQPADEELLAYFNLPSEPGNNDFVSDNSYTETFRLSNYDHDLIYTGYTNWDAGYVYLRFEHADGTQYNYCYDDNNSLIYLLDCDDPSTGIPSGSWSDNYYVHSLSSNDSEAVNSVLCEYSVEGCTFDWADNYDPLVTDDDGTCYKEGCTLDWADNYDEYATIDDGSCELSACMSDWADNYDELATTDDGSCDRLGCMSDWADNYDELATTDDSSCFKIGCPYPYFLEYDSLHTIPEVSMCYNIIVEGCTDGNAINYNYNANVDDGSCIIYGCSDSLADNYYENVTIDDGSCFVYGCNNPTAINYMDNATENDGSCIIYGCTFEAFPNYNYLATNDDLSCSPTSQDIYGCTDLNADNYLHNATVDNGECYYYGCIYTWADNYNSQATINDGYCYRLGCTQDWADNYDILATVNDEACYKVGCMSSWADNYDYYANVNDSSCIRLGCTSDWADNYDTLATNNDGSCYLYGCPYEFYIEYDPQYTIADEGMCQNIIGSCIEGDDDNDGVCNNDEIQICGDENACNFESLEWYPLTIDINNDLCEYPQYGYDCRGACLNDFDNDEICDEYEVNGCTYFTADNYDSLATNDDGSCDIYQLYDQIDVLEVMNSVLQSENNYLNSVLSEYDSLLESCLDLSTPINPNICSDIIIECQQTTDSLMMIIENQYGNIYINLIEGWNMIGYTLPFPQDVTATLEQIVEHIEIVKNNDADVYWPEYGFNGIGDFIPGQGYQIRMFNAVDSYSFPDVGGLRIELTPTVPDWVHEIPIPCHPNDTRTLVRVVNMLGQQVDPDTRFKGEVLLYLFSDGTTEKRVVE